MRCDSQANGHAAQSYEYGWLPSIVGWVLVMNGTATSFSPTPRKPPTPTITAETLPILRTESLSAASSSFRQSLPTSAIGPSQCQSPRVGARPHRHVQRRVRQMIDQASAAVLITELWYKRASAPKSRQGPERSWSTTRIRPIWLDHVTVNELPVGNGATLHFRRGRDGVEVGMTAVERPLHLTSASTRFLTAFFAR